jgi:SPP1 family predicted phage head-tail adaptor
MRSNLAAGHLRDRITISTPTPTLDKSGQPIRTYAPFLTSAPCAARGVGGGEVIRGRQMHAEATMLFVLRHVSGVTQQMRATWNGSTLGILRAYDPIGDRVELHIEAKHEPS